MNLTLFFTYKTSLERWENIGLFDREVALYRKYLEKGVRLSFITYGKNDHVLFRDRLPGIEILCNAKRLPTKLYTTLIPVLHAQTLMKTDIIKTNQTPGGLVALKSAERFGKPLLARCGYMHSEFMANRYGVESKEAAKALNDENRLFSKAEKIEVTTPVMKENILSRLPETCDRITVIPNYVDTDVFAPSEVQRDIDLLFIGRLVPQKNLTVLLDAIQGMDLQTLIIGSGSLEHELRAKALELGVDITWKSNILNNELPAYLNRAKIFILPSLYEGHPKTLIEAMACGRPVIGMDMPGVREVIHDGETGCLCGTAPEDIRRSIKKLLSSEALCKTLGRNSRKFAVSNYSIEQIVEKEHQLLFNTLP